MTKVISPHKCSELTNSYRLRAVLLSVGDRHHQVIAKEDQLLRTEMLSHLQEEDLNTFLNEFCMILMYTKVRGTFALRSREQMANDPECPMDFQTCYLLPGQWKVSQRSLNPGTTWSREGAEPVLSISYAFPCSSSQSPQGIK